MYEVQKTVGSLRLPDKNRVSQLHYICASALALRPFPAQRLLLPAIIVICTDIHDFVVNRQVNSLLTSCGWSRFHSQYSRLPSSSGSRHLHFRKFMMGRLAVLRLLDLSEQGQGNVCLIMDKS
jgi:hypothetical protein